MQMTSWQKLRRSSQQPIQPNNTPGRHLRADGLLNLSSALRPRSWKTAILGALAILASGMAAAQSTDVFAESITLTIPSDPLTLDITPTDEGTFSDSNNATVSVTTDALAGYTLTVKSDNGNNDLANGESKIPSISSQIPESTASSNFTANSWGYLPSKFNGSGNSDFRPGPDREPDTLDATHAKNEGSTKTDYTIKLGAKVNTQIPSGGYSNTFVFTATTNETHYTVTYHDNANGNGEDGEEGTVTNMPENVKSGTTYDTTVTVGSTSPTYNGHNFLGWCDTTPTRNGTENDSCPDGGHIYGSADSVGIAATANGNTTWTLTEDGDALILYAMWQSAEPTTMQDFGSYCSQMTMDDGNNGNGITIMLTDTRDNSQYKVAKLKDGRCWMVDNLKYATGVSYTDSTYGGYYTYGEAQSACPTGWRLPIQSEYYSLSSAYGAGSNGSLLAAKPVPGFVYAGYYNDSSLEDKGYRGYYWSSTADGSIAYSLRLDDYSSADAASRFSFSYGLSVRCVAKE